LPSPSYFGKPIGVVRRRIDRFGQVPANLVAIDVERRGKLDVVDVISAEVHVHQPRNPFVFGGIAVEFHALDERRGAVADADEGDANFAARLGF
jgi:hypothetical protein